MSCYLDRVLYLNKNDVVSFIVKRNINNANNYIITYSGTIDLIRI